MSAQSMATAAGLMLVLSSAPVAAQEGRTAHRLANQTSTVEWLPERFDRNHVRLPGFDHSPGSLPAVALWEPRLMRQGDSTSQNRQPPARENWIKKRPARFGALVGAGIGTVPAFYEMATCPPTRSCSTAGAGVLFGAAAGAGIGAFTGWMISRVVGNN